MDASASSEVDAELKDLFALFLKIEGTNFPTSLKQRNTVIKYTKLPEFDFDTKGSWAQNSALQPRLRRLVTLEDPIHNTSRSLKFGPLHQHSGMATTMNNRKIVTISEDDEYDLHPKFSNERKKSSTPVSNRAVETVDAKKDNFKYNSKKNTSRLSSSVKYAKDTKCAAKISSFGDIQDINSRKSSRNKISNQTPIDMKSRTIKIEQRNKDAKDTKSAAKISSFGDIKENNSRISSRNKISNQTPIDIQSRAVKIEDQNKDSRKPRSAMMSKTSISKNLVKPTENEQELSLVKSKLHENVSSKPTKKIVEKSQPASSPAPPVKTKALTMEMQKKRKATPIIHVPIEDKYRRNILEDLSSQVDNPSFMMYSKSDGSVDTEIILQQNIHTSTVPPPGTAEKNTDMDGYELQVTEKNTESSLLQTSLYKEMYDKLDVPNVSLKKDKENLLNLHSMSLPNLQVPPINVIDNRKENSVVDTHYSKSTSYIISRATLTYKTHQKINFHVVDSNEKDYSNQSPSPMKYPMNIVSVFKGEMHSKDVKRDLALKNAERGKSCKKYKNSVNKIKSLNCPYIPNSNKLMKPSDVISTIRVNNSLLHNVLVCEQFQRELNFIDSFFESLQYLENGSISGKCYKDDKINHLVNNSRLLESELNAKHTDYDSFLSKLEIGANSSDDIMASKNLFLLNILIRDEQRRAKNLLCVLKRREDALKDFTKSQILYLENKKKQENTDISALKKKQRGALLKLQHECGEMQRMRKALLALSEKRKIALMKTKKDLELKLKNHVDVEQIILEKKKLKRSTVLDRTSVPLKCFDLSSSGCEDSTTSRYASDGAVSVPDGHPSSQPFIESVSKSVAQVVTSAEKGIQTGDSILCTTQIEIATNTVEENFVAVDGGYLNILFHNLCLPQIFSDGKQYEVNQDALKNIIDTTTLRQDPVDNWNDVVEKLMSQSKSDDEDKGSTPSTARSLVEEFEQYYKSLGEEDQIQEEINYPRTLGNKESEAEQQTSLCVINSPENKTSVDTMTTRQDCEENVDESQCASDEDVETPEQSPSPVGQAGPLPVPAGAPDVNEPVYFDGTLSPAAKSSDTSTSGDATDCSGSSQPPCEVQSGEMTLEPAQAEAEELRRQQLAIEREIKELEQQQSRLLVVREIPDKPPPPYTPPAETRPPKLPRPFKQDDVIRERIRDYITNPSEPANDLTDAFDTLVHDFCIETVQKHQLEQSDKPWDSSNLLPQKPPLDKEKLIAAVSSELDEVLITATPSLVSGVSSRRSDHIDDILFSEWRRAEPEWTSLHADEAVVKNQLFETIFQRLLTETVDEYKRTVLTPPPPVRDKSVIL